VTDDQLLQWVRETPREELTAGEIAELRRRIGHSTELRQALADEIQLEAALGDALGQVQISLEWIFTRAAAVPRAGRMARLYGWGAISAVALAITSVGVVIGLRGPDEPRQVAQDKTGDGTGPGHRDSIVADENESPAPMSADESAAAAAATQRERHRERVAAPLTQSDPDDDDAPPQNLTADPVRWFGDSCFDELALRVGPPASRWDECLRPLVDARLIDIGGKAAGMAISGLVELVPALDEGRVVRMALTNHDRLKLHCWSGASGVTLEFSQSPHPAWAAYASTRRLDALRPGEVALVATDSGRYRRTGQGTVELRHQDGLLVLSRGDVPLIVAPLANTPKQVVFDGSAVLRGLEVVSSGPFPLADDRNGSDAALPDLPAALDWLRHPLAPGQWRTLPGGGIELQVDGAADGDAVPHANRAGGDWAATRIDHAAGREIVFEIDDPRPASGVYLGDETGQPLWRIGFFQVEGPDHSLEQGRIGYDFSAPGDTRTTFALEGGKGPQALAGRHMWLRLVAGCGSLSCWTSGDGIHWGLALEPLRPLDCRFSTAGVYCRPADGTSSIRLLRLEARPLAKIESLTSASLAGRAPVPNEVPDLDDWQRSVYESQPDDVGADDWWRACAVRTLAAGAPPSLANPLLLTLLAKAVVSDETPAERLRLLDEAALIVDGGDATGLAGFVSLYDRLGQALTRQGQRRAYSLLRPRIMASPLATSLDLDLALEGLARAELFELAYRGDWESLGQTCRTIRFFGGGAEGPSPSESYLSGRKRVLALVESCERLVAAQLPLLGADAAGRPAQPHPWVEQVGKEGYNLSTELASALDARAYRDACGVIANAAIGTSEGLLPDAVDRQWFVSLPALVEVALREHPPLAGLLAGEFSQTAIARLRRATADDDFSTVQAVAMQFHGTPPAAKAQRWLGDRALAGGQFTRALAHFSAALRYAPSAEQKQLAARRRLAAAMLGRDLGEPPEEGVQLGDGHLAPDEFERLVADMRARGASSAMAGSDKPPVTAAPLPARYELRPWARLDNVIAVPLAASQDQSDLMGRQLAVAVTPSALIVAAPTRIEAYDLADRACLWSFSLEADSSANLVGPAMTGLATPMRPLLAGARLFARQSTAKGPELFALDISNGRLLWRQAAAGPVVGDPLLVEYDLLAPCVAPAGNGLTELSLVTFDPNSGNVRERFPLTRFHALVAGELACHASVAGEMIVITAGGTTIACDLVGRLQWLRRHLWFPPPLDGNHTPCHVPPLVAGDFVYVAQPGVRAVECLELATGRLCWKRVQSDLDRIVGLAAGRLIVRTRSGWVGLDAESGQPDWYRDQPHWLEAVLFGADGRLMSAEYDHDSDDERADQRGTKNHGARWVWIDGRTGDELARCPLSTSPDARVGPLFGAGDRFFGLAELEGPGPRAIVELVKAEELP
jgi:outer membrane protein assembly factor BamB